MPPPQTKPSPYLRPFFYLSKGMTPKEGKEGRNQCLYLLVGPLQNSNYLSKSNWGSICAGGTILKL